MTLWPSLQRYVFILKKRSPVAKSCSLLFPATELRAENPRCHRCVERLAGAAPVGYGYFFVHQSAQLRRYAFGFVSDNEHCIVVQRRFENIVSAKYSAIHGFAVRFLKRLVGAAPTYQCFCRARRLLIRYKRIYLSKSVKITMHQESAQRTQYCQVKQP